MAACGAGVLLGVSDSPCSGPVLSPYENKIGGYPDFFSSSSLPTLPHCALCKDPVQLLVQVYCPLEGSLNHRLLHVYCCTRPQCTTRNEGWLALRSEKRDDSCKIDELSSTDTTVGHLRPTQTTPGTTMGHSRPTQTTMDHSRPTQTTVNHSRPTQTTVGHSRPTQTKTTEVAVNEWCVGENDWGEENTNKEEFSGNLITTVTQELDKLKVSTPETAAATLSFTEQAYFTPMYISVVEEPSASEDTDTCRVEELLEKYKMENGVGAGGQRDGSKQSAQGKRGTGSGSEKYEKMVAKHGDRTFQKFKKKLSLCPEQILRYCWKGEPLLISDSNHPPKVDQVTCKSCGATAAFEFQLMPPLVYLLQKNTCVDAQSGSSCVEFGTVLVYSCHDSCWSEKDGGFREESVFVLSEPETESLNKVTQEHNRA